MPKRRRTKGLPKWPGPGPGRRGTVGAARRARALRALGKTWAFPRAVAEAAEDEAVSHYPSTLRELYALGKVSRKDIGKGSIRPRYVYKKGRK